MKLLTLNTHSLIEPEYEAKREIFVEFIAKEQPDVFALQEVNQTAAAPLLAGVPAGYYPCPGNMVLLKADNHAAAVARMLEEADCAYHWSWLPAKIGYDRYSAQYLITDMANYGFHMDDVYQGENLTPVIREFEGIIKDGDFKIADNNLLKTHFLNVALKHNMETRKFRPIKIEQRAHIDGFVSVIDAMTVRQKYWEECGELLKNAA